MNTDLHAKLDSLLAECDARRPFERLPAGHPQGGKYGSEAAVREARWQRELKKAEENDKRLAAAAAKPAAAPRPATPKPTAPKPAAARPPATRPSTAVATRPATPPAVRAPALQAGRYGSPMFGTPQGPRQIQTPAQRGAVTTPSIWDKLKQRVTGKPSDTQPAKGNDVSRVLKEEFGGKVPGATSNAFRELVRKDPVLWGKIHQQMEANAARPSAPVRALQSVGKAVGGLVAGLKPYKIGGETRRQFERRLASTPKAENPYKRALELAELNKAAHINSAYGGESPQQIMLAAKFGE